MGDFFNLAHALERDARGHFFQGFGLHAQGHFGFDKARCNPGYPNAVARQLLGPGHGCRRNPGLGRRVVGLADIAGTGDRRNIDDRALAVELDHFRRHLTGAQEHPGQVDINHRLPLRQAHLGHDAILDLEQQPVTQDSGVVDKTIDRAKIFCNLGHGLRNLFFVSDIAQVSASLDTVCLTGRNGQLELFRVEVDQCQFGALGRQVLGHCTAQALAAASDNDYFVF